MAANDRLNSLLAGLEPEQREIPCYHPGGIVKAQNFMDLRLKELAVHEWDIRAALESKAHVSSASIRHYDHDLRIDRVRFAQMGLLGRAIPDDTRTLSLCGDGTGTQQARCHCGGQYTPYGRCGDTTARVTVRCDTETYVLLVYGRLDLEAALASGRLMIEGDRELALAFGRWFRGI